MLGVQVVVQYSRSVGEGRVLEEGGLFECDLL